MQMPDDMKWDRMNKLISEVKQNYKEVKHEYLVLPCQNCQLSERIDYLVTQEIKYDENERLKFAQEVAALDCQRYRLAESLYTPPSSDLEPPKFKKIVILDDNSGFRKLLKKEFEKLRDTGLIEDKLVDSDELVDERIDEKLCWKNFGLFTEGEDKENPGKKKTYEVIDKLLEDNQGLKESEILTCFDLDLGSPPKSDSGTSSPVDDFIKTCFGGHWVLYGSARRHPKVPRLVVTGFRSQELLSYTAGGSAYLLKPITTENLVAKVKEASILHRVTWLCPQEIRDEYRNFVRSNEDRSLDFDTIHRHLAHWLNCQRIELEVIENAQSHQGRICESEVIVIDLLKVNEPETQIEELIAKIAKVRQLNPHASIIVILPLVEEVNDPFASYYRQLPLNLRDGSDLIIRKPMWIAEHPQHELALGSAIVHQLKRLEDYDTKYQVLIPIKSLLENSSEQFLNLVDCMKAHGNASQTISDKIIKPLTQVFGGVSSYELGIRGSWYDAESQKIDDTIIVVEFCAKSSLMAKEFIEKTVVRYLKQVAGEDVVLLQEIPIRGRLL
jgi:CheY-like chemotaxis protein